MQDCVATGGQLLSGTWRALQDSIALAKQSERPCDLETAGRSRFAKRSDAPSGLEHSRRALRGAACPGDCGAWPTSRSAVRFCMSSYSRRLSGRGPSHGPNWDQTHRVRLLSINMNTMWW